jgi:hypothetical protein
MLVKEIISKPSIATNNVSASTGSTNLIPGNALLLYISSGELTTNVANSMLP